MLGYYPNSLACKIIFFLKQAWFFEHGSPVFSKQPQEVSQHYHLKSYFGSV